MWPFLSNVFEMNLSNEDKVTYFNLIINSHNLKFEKEDAVDFLKNKIQELISLPLKRNEGMVLMFAAIEQDSTFYIENWGPIVVGSLKCPDSYIPKKLTLKILNKIIMNFSQESIYKNTFQKFIPDILPLLLNLENEIYEHCCRTLSVCMKCIPQIVGPHEVEIERFLLKKLDCTCTKTIEAITECFAALPMCQMHFKKATKNTYGDMWLDIYLRILNTIQMLLNDILQRKEGDVNGSIGVFALPYLEDKECNTLSNIRSFSTLCKCLAKMMSTETCQVQVPIEDLLLSMQRVFQVTNLAKDSDGGARITSLKLAYPIMINAVLIVLEAVILNFPMIEQCSNIVTVISKSLEGIHATSSPKASICRTRSTIWKLSNIWLTRYGSKGSSEIVREKFLIQEILKDIAVDNTDDKQLENQLSSRIESEDTLKNNNIMICAEALKVLRTMIHTGGCFMENNCLDNISTTVIKVARQLLLHLNPSKQFPLPYSDEKCRKRLYDLLLTCSIAGDPLQTKCIIKSVNIFRIALKDPSIKVSEVCHRGFIHCRFFLNSKKPPPDAIGFSNANMFNRHVPATIEMLRGNWRDHSWSRSSDVDMSNEETQNEEDDEEAYNNTDESIREVNDQEDDDDEEDYGNFIAESNEMQDLDDRNPDEVEEMYSSEMGSSQINMRNTASCHGESQMVELRTEKYASEEREVNVPTHHNSRENAMHTHQNSADSEFEEEEGEEETSVTNYEKENVNGMDYIEEEDDDDDNEEEEANDECGDEYTSVEKISEDHYEERMAKRQKVMIETEADETEVNNNSSPSASSSEEGTEIETQVNKNKYSPRNKKTNTSKSISDEENENEKTERSPTVKEMCCDFVLAEPTEES